MNRPVELQVQTNVKDRTWDQVQARISIGVHRRIRDEISPPGTTPWNSVGARIEAQVREEL